MTATKRTVMCALIWTQISYQNEARTRAWYCYVENRSCFALAGSFENKCLCFQQKKYDKRFVHRNSMGFKLRTNSNMIRSQEGKQ